LIKPIADLSYDMITEAN